MFSLDAFWKGLVVASTATILGKVVAGLHTGEYRWVIGFAMVGRGEFAYLVAESSKNTCYLGTETATEQQAEVDPDPKIAKSQIQTTTPEPGRRRRKIAE